jgi:hypothetical protein
MLKTLSTMRLPPDVISQAMAVIESTRPQFRFPPSGPDAAPVSAGAGFEGPGKGEGGLHMPGTYEATGSRGEAGGEKQQVEEEGAGALSDALGALALTAEGHAEAEATPQGRSSNALAGGATVAGGAGGEQQVHPAAGEYARCSWEWPEAT